MRRGEAGRSKYWHQKPETLACPLDSRAVFNSNNDDDSDMMMITMIIICALGSVP